MYYFSLDKHRNIFETADITYKSGILHPARDCPDFHDFVFMKDGTWDFTVNGETYDVCPGDVFVLPAGSTYSGISLCSPENKNIFIHVRPVEGDGVETENAVPLNTLIHCQNDSVVEDLFTEISMVYNSNQPGKDAMLSVIFQSLLCYLFRCDRRTIIRDHDIVDECLEIMKQNPGIFYKESEIASRLFISTKTLRNSFVKRYNKTFYRYQIDCKLDQALTLFVSNPELKVYEVAYELGFCDEFHLSKTFKKKFGMSPNAYKRKYGIRDDKGKG